MLISIVSVVYAINKGTFPSVPPQSHIRDIPSESVFYIDLESANGLPLKLMLSFLFKFFQGFIMHCNTIAVTQYHTITEIDPRQIIF